ncbi:MAG: glycerol-3-phosphate 1-O-acyltransferase [Pseudomonadales bacterium]
MHTSILNRSSPWPLANDSECVFILDVINSVEQEILTQWINHHRPENQPPPRIVAINLSDDTRGIDAKPLLAALNLVEKTLLVPVRIAWRRAPQELTSRPRVRDLLLGDPRRPKPVKARKLSVEEPERVYLLAGQSATLNDLQQRFLEQNVQPDSEHELALAGFIARQAALTLDITERKLRGGRYKVPRHVAEVLRNSPAFLRDVESLAQKSGRSKQDLLTEADGYMKEMITQPRTFWLDIYAKFNNFLLGLGYEDKVVYDAESIEKMRSMVRDHPALLLWTHKTYLDGAVVPKVMYDNDFPTPHMFGGANLSFAGLGALLRRSGAIFIRRSFQDNDLYKLTLRHYIGLLMDKRFPMNWSFEGTRSRLGKLMPPRYGLLKYVLEACHASDARNIHIIPVSISYDLIRDVEEYATEQMGRQKSAESLSWFIGYIRSLAKPMGKVYMDIGEPVVLERAPDPDDRLALSKIAFQVAVQANNVTPLTFPSLVTTSLLAKAPRAQTERQVIQDIRELLHYAEQRELRVSEDFDLDYADHMDGLLGIMIDEGIVTRYDQGPDIVYGIAPDQHAVASYYRNTVIHFFVNKALIELALLKASDAAESDASDVFWQEIENLRDLFKFEFFYAPSEEFRQEIIAELNLCDPDWQVKLGQGPEQILRMLNTMTPLLAHATLQSYVEAYSVVADMLTRLAVNETLEEKACVEQALKFGRQAYLQRRINSEASIGKLLFKNAHQLMQHRRLLDAGSDNLEERRKAMARELRQNVLRLDRLKAIEVSRGEQV